MASKSGIEIVRRRVPWVAENPFLMLPTVSPFRPPPSGSYYPLTVRETSRVATGGSISPSISPSSSSSITQRRPTPRVAIGTRYAFTANETAECVRIGRERNDKNKREHRANRRYTAYRNDEDIAIQGVFGEYAFARLFDLSIDIHDTTCRSAATEKRFDGVMTPEGWTVDVKTTVRAGVPLRVTWWKMPNPPHAYALLIYVNYIAGKPLDERAIAPPVIEFRGFASSATIFSDQCRVDTTDANGDRDIVYVLHQDRLVDREGLHAESVARGGAIRHRPPPAT